MPKTTSNRPHLLPPTFFERPTLVVARQLLGMRLARVDEKTGERRICRVVETEAYTGDDPACHAYGKCTGRAATLYKRPGLSYVYLIYGLHHCLNVVTEPEGVAGAVLFRALEPDTPELKTHGPGRLARALGITREIHNEVDMNSETSPLYLLEGRPVADADVIQTTRIGISQGKDLPWRFYVKGNPWVSVP